MEAWTLQGGGGVLLMVVNDQERNVFDQGFIEASLWQKHQIRTVRASFSAISLHFTLEPGTNIGLYHGLPISIIYYRAGYTPNDYKTAQDWETREKHCCEVPLHRLPPGRSQKGAAVVVL